ncbi:MAG: hypothetical protein Q8M31_08855 [Beijerinckiaceae bacterium]|nr:hypothetical protein [Beijerinckiaceae bacterium]
MADRAHSTGDDARPVDPDTLFPGAFQRWFCAKWQANMSLASYHWASSNAVSDHGGAKDTPESEGHISDANAAAAEAEELLARIEGMRPEDALVAHEMLGVADEILVQRQRDPEARLGKGDVLAIIRNVRDELGYLGIFPLGQRGLELSLEVQRREDADSGSGHADRDIMDLCARAEEARLQREAAEQRHEEANERGIDSHAARAQVEALNKEAQRLYNVAAGLREKLMFTRPRTMEGVVAKARVAAANYGGVDFLDGAVRRLLADDDFSEALCMSVVADIAALDAAETEAQADG